MSHPFEVGKTYRNRAGEYVVQSIDGNNMKIRYVGGGTLDTRVDLQTRIWENIQFEKQMAREEERRRLAQEARREARRRVKQAQIRAQFEGFQESDFEPTKRRIAWSGRKEMGSILAYEFRQQVKGTWGYWIIPRKSGVNVARRDHFDKEIRDTLALFFVSVDEHGVTYGLNVPKPSGKIKRRSHWAMFLTTLSDEEKIRASLRTAMETHELSMDVYLAEQSYGRVARITVEDGQFLQQMETAEQEVTHELDGEELVEYLEGLAPTKAGEVFVRGHISPDTALKMGIDIAQEISAACKDLLPLYDAIVGA